MDRLQAWGAQLIGVFRDTLEGIVTYLPIVLTAVVVLVIGWLIAHVMRGLVRRAARVGRGRAEREPGAPGTSGR